MWFRQVRLLDVAVAVGFLAVGLAEELTAPAQLPYWWARLALGTTLVLSRRAAPLSTMVLDVVLLQGFLMPHDVANYRVWQAACLLIGLHTVGREVILTGADRHPVHRRVAALVIVAGTVVFLLSQDLTMRSDYFATGLYTLAAWVSGLLLQIQARRIAERNAAVAAAEELQAREALAEERGRIARELHDIVAHSVTVMVLQAGVVRRRLATRQDAERDLLSTVEAAGREAVTELHRTLGLLRGPEPSAMAPQPGLDRLDDLVDQLREAGLTVRLHTGGAPERLPPSLDLSAYRIVQEALTNVLKHSGATRADVTVDYGADELRLTVLDPGGRASARPTAGARHGLVGMRERAAMFGGRLEAAPEPSGGYRVTARLPVRRGTDATGSVR